MFPQSGLMSDNLYISETFKFVEKVECDVGDRLVFYFFLSHAEHDSIAANPSCSLVAHVTASVKLFVCRTCFLVSSI